MKNILKRCLSVFLAVSIVICCDVVGFNGFDISGPLAVKSNAADSDVDGHTIVNGICTKCGIKNDFSYSVRDGFVEINGYIGSESEIVLPSSIDGLPVTNIAHRAFSYNEKLTSVTIPDSVTFIGLYAFESCGNLSSITIGNGVTEICECAFNDTAYYWDSDNWENEVLYIGKYLIDADQHDLYGSCIIKDGTKVIADYAFESCYYLKSVEIPDSVTVIGDFAFNYCEELSSVVLSKNLISIGTYAFGNCYFITEIDLPDTLLSIGNEAFIHCSSLEEVIIPEGVKTIGYAAFSYCSQLASITVPDSVESIGGDAFYYTQYYKNSDNWDEEGALYIGNHLIDAQDNIGSYKVKDGTKTIADSAFYSCSELKSITIPDGIICIGSNTFQYCESLVEVIIPNSVTSIGSYAFNDCSSLEAITLPQNLKTIENNAFNGCTELTSIVIPDSVEYIDYRSFYDCVSLDSIAIPDGVAFIGNNVIFNTRYYNNENNWDKGVLYIGNHLLEANEDEAKGVYIVKSGTISISELAFGRCTMVTSVVIPDSVKIIGGSAFHGCRNLIAVTIGDGVTDIGDYAFEECENLTVVKMGKNVKNIGRNAFFHCPSLISIKLPVSINFIGGRALGYQMSSTEVVGTNEDFTIYGIKNSVSEAYATLNKLKFVAVDEACTHSLTNSVTDKRGTCSKNGIEHVFCTECFEILDIIIVPASGEHNSSDWLIDKSPSVNSAGKKHKECTECGEVLETATIAQLKAAKPKLKTISNTEYGVKITWGKVSGADKYRVYRKTSKGDWKYLGSTSKTYYTDKTAKSGTKYYYAVKSRNEAGNSSLSSSLSKYYLADTTLKTPSSTKSGITLKWSKVTGAEGYMVYRKTGTGSYSKVATVKGSRKVTYTDKSAKKGKKYTYKVKAYKSKTYSAYSNTKTIKDKY